MKIVFTPKAWNDYLWFQQHDKRLLKKINALIKDATRDPFSGIGKPEQLKGDLSGCWSRRINSEHRLVYYITEDEFILVGCRFHYN